MSIKEQGFTNRLSITIAVVVLLCAAGFAYSQGWFDWARPTAVIESDKVSADQMLDQDKSKDDAAKVTQATSEPAATPAE